MPPKIKLIFNPMANLGRAWQVAALLRPIVEENGQADWAGTVYPTHATQLAAQAARDGYDWVIAMGGDGTVNEVINGLMEAPREQRPCLGVVPVGSGNDFSFSLGMDHDPETAMRQVFAGQVRPVDVAHMEDNQGRQKYWANALGIGFDTIVTIHSRKVPVVKGFAVYLAAVLQTILFDYNVYNLKITMDGRAWQQAVLMLVLANGRREGGGFMVAPGATLDDGSLDYNAVDRISRLRMLMTLPYYLKGTQNGLSYIRAGQFQRLELESDRPLHIHTDGEIFAGFGSQTTWLKTEILHDELTAIYGK